MVIPLVLPSKYTCLSARVKASRYLEPHRPPNIQLIFLQKKTPTIAWFPPLPTGSSFSGVSLFLLSDPGRAARRQAGSDRF